WTDWSGTTFTFVLLGLFFPVFNLLFSLAIGAILRRLHVAKMKQEITQAVEEDVYLNPAFHGGVALACESQENNESEREKRRKTGLKLTWISSDQTHQCVL
ncbi:putative transmembrane protein, partial [Toxoplasma gondii CAST]